MSKKEGRIKRQVTSVPQNLDGAAEFVRQIGERQRFIDKIQLQADAEAGKLRTKAMADITPLQEEIAQLVEGLFAFAESHRKELTKDGKHKTVILPTGQFGWRMTPWAVHISNTKSVVVILEKLGLKRFIRIEKVPDKEAMLKEKEVAEKVRGVSIKRHEDFVVKPVKLEVEITSRTDKLKRVVF